MKIGVVGSSSIDVFAVSKFFRPQAEDRQAQIVLAHGSKLWLDDSINEPGGGGLLSSIVFARQDHKTYLLTVIANDLFGSEIKTVAREEGFALLGNIDAIKSHTDTTVHLSSNSQDQTTMHFDGSFNLLNKKDIQSLPTELDWLHIASLPKDKSVFSKIVKFAKSNSIQISINPRYTHNMSTKQFLKTIRNCDLLVINRDEASMLLGSFGSHIEVAKKLYDSQIKHVVVYGGDDGSAVAFKGNIYSIESNYKIKPIEYSGAESVFAAAYAEKYAATLSFEQALTHAQAQACSVKTISGARSAILKQPLLEPIKIKVHDNIEGEL